MQRLFRALGLSALAAIAVMALVACGGDDDAEDDPAPTNTTAAGETPAPTAPGTPVGPLTDEEYLAVVCSGLEDYTAAVLRETTVEGLAAVVQDYVASLQGVLPPADLEDFHSRFIDYLVAAIESPTDLLAIPRPLPEEDVRERLAGKEDDVPECADASFFSEREEDAT